MPSRKKAKGKARRAAKAAKEEESQAVVAAVNQNQERPIEAQMQRLLINAITPQKCQHGLAPLSPSDAKICLEFIRTFFAAYTSRTDNVAGSLIAAHDATKETYTHVYSSKMEAVVSILVTNGTQCILDGHNEFARVNALLACSFEELIAVQVNESKAIYNWGKLFELNNADDHTLIAYLRKRIDCTCFDEKYKEVKSVKKMGFCFDPNCSRPERKVQRSKMLYCKLLFS